MNKQARSSSGTTTIAPSSVRRCLLVLPFSLTASLFSLASFSSSSSSSPSSPSSSFPLAPDPLRVREMLGTTSHSRAKGLGLFLLKQKRRRGYAAAASDGQRRSAATIVGRATKRKKRGKRLEREKRRGGCHRGILAEVYFRPCQQSLCKALFFPSLAHISSLSFSLPWPIPLSLSRSPASLPPFIFTPPRRSSSPFFYVYGTLGFSLRTASDRDDLGGAILPRRLRRYSLLHFDTSRTVILMRCFAIDREGARGVLNISKNYFHDEKRDVSEIVNK